MASPSTRKKRPTVKPAKKQPTRVLPRTRVPAAVRAMAAPTGTARFSAGKALVVTAKRDPARVYPYFDALAALLASESKVVRWNALQVIASLACVDTDHKVDSVLDVYLGWIRRDNLISAANAIQGAGQIARARPDLRERIIRALVGVEGARYETAECRNVAIGHALDTLSALGPAVCQRAGVAAFILRQTWNPRAAVARRAKQMAAGLA